MTPSWPRVLERLKTEEGAVSYIRYAEEAGYRPITSSMLEPFKSDGTGDSQTVGLTVLEISFWVVVIPYGKHIYIN